MNQNEIAQICHECVTLVYSDYKGNEVGCDLQNCNFVPDRIEVKGYISPNANAGGDQIIAPLYSFGDGIYFPSNTFAVYTNMGITDGDSPLCIMNFNNTSNTFAYMNPSRMKPYGLKKFSVKNNGVLLETGSVIIHFTYIRYGDKK